MSFHSPGQISLHKSSNIKVDIDKAADNYVRYRKNIKRNMNRIMTIRNTLIKMLVIVTIYCKAIGIWLDLMETILPSLISPSFISTRKKDDKSSMENGKLKLYAVAMLHFLTWYSLTFQSMPWLNMYRLFMLSRVDFLQYFISYSLLIKFFKQWKRLDFWRTTEEKCFIPDFCWSVLSNWFDFQEIWKSLEVSERSAKWNWAF